MGFPISAGLLDSMVLSVVDREDTYGYEITQFIRSAVDVSESTLYPVLKRLQKNELLETYDKEYMGRNRRYYHVTPKGEKALEVSPQGYFPYACKSKVCNAWLADAF